MNEEQLRQRALFVDTLTNAEWRGSNFNRNFDEGLWSSPEASMTYSNRQLALRIDLLFEDPRLILYVTSKTGKGLGLVFKCLENQGPLLEALIRIQDILTPDNIKEKTKELVTTCRSVFKISASGDRLIPLKEKKAE
jgi:hypothetical protein